MINLARFIILTTLLAAVPEGLRAVDERNVRFSGGALLGMAEYASGLTEAGMVRPGSVLLLSSERRRDASADLALSFDEGSPFLFADSAGRYRVSVAPSVEAVGARNARVGAGAVLFQGRLPVGSPAGTDGPLTIEPRTAAALFAPNNGIRDFSLEFWVHPFGMENGEEILRWSASRRAAGGNLAFQNISVTAARNRFHWNFSNFFVSPDRTASVDIALSGLTPLVPRTWSHHLIRFDAASGLIEYLVNGRTEAVAHATTTGREGGEVFTPVAGENGRFVLGGNFSGMMDEFGIRGALAPEAAMRRYPLHGGRIETRAIDMGAGNNRVLMLEASGGRATIREARAASEFRRNGTFRFSDDSEMRFFVRASDNPFRWDSPWQPVTPGQPVPAGIVGRYAQIAVDFYPSAGGDTSPFLEEVGLVFLRDEPPMPPSRLVAVAMDGAVHLTWRHSPNPSAQGYLVFYGTAYGDFFGEGALLGASPISVGMTNSVVIEGLQNGVLYFFRVAAYSHRGTNHLLDGSADFHAGEFSNEARARPLRGR